MKENLLFSLPSMLYADKEGRIFEHDFYRMAGFYGNSPYPLDESCLVPLPEFSKLFFLPDCPPVGLNPESGQWETVFTAPFDRGEKECFAVAAFMEPGWVRVHLPAAVYKAKKYTLPMWAYTAVGCDDNGYIASAFRVEYNHRWDPNNFDDKKLIRAIKKYRKNIADGALTSHLGTCAVDNHCFAAKNLFLERWEMPVPVSVRCNARCLGCISLQTEKGCKPSHQRISFRPDPSEIITMALHHIKHAEDPIISFGQGCEGEPLTEYELIGECISSIRKKTSGGTINLNTNGSNPEQIKFLIDSGLDSIRISMSSARPDFYNAYHRPISFSFDDVRESVKTAANSGIYTMLNYLVFPGVTDCEPEFSALSGLIDHTGLNFIHLKNLCIDPDFYLVSMPGDNSLPFGMNILADRIKERFPDLELGYFNKAIKR